MAMPRRGILAAAFLLVLFVLVLAMSACSGDSPNRVVADVERGALTALYGSTGGENWDWDGNWLTDAPLGDWYGISTDGSGRVIAVNLPRNNLSGTIPPEIGNLRELRYLYLEDNRLVGSLPGELTSLVNVEALDLSGNSLTGNIPNNWDGLVSLRILSLSGNRLTGPSATPISLEDRRVLELFYAESGGPSWIGKTGWLSDFPLYMWHGVAVDINGRVTSLALNNNRLAGQMTSDLGRLELLARLLLHNNELTGSIPEELGNLTRLEWLVLGDNQLTGQIPSQFGKLTNLRSLYLGNVTPSGNNRFTGCIPAPLRSIASNDLQDLGLPFCE